MQRLTAFGEGVIEDSITLDVWETRPTEHKPTLLLIAYHHRSRSSDSDTQEVTTTRNGLVAISYKYSRTDQQVRL